KLNWPLIERDEHASLRRLYKELLRLRREHPALRKLDLASLETRADDAKQVLLVRRWSDAAQALTAFNFSDRTQTVEAWEGRWHALIDTGAKIENGRATLPPHAFAVWES
ncbi:MAG TPA: DUF3459 domain-containing protein, partial [Thermoanaerobaculia bacterium]|nr:DUF3459 domain-containing protein [Thermoanaerobaculia bacterium]